MKKQKGLPHRLSLMSVFTRHSLSEAGEVLRTGDRRKPLSPEEVSNEMARPWLFSRIWLLLFSLYVLLLAGNIIYVQPFVVPNLVVIGSFATPIAMVILFYELNVWRNISMWQLLAIFLVGGVVAVLLSYELSDLIPRWGETSHLSHSLRIGLIEEVSKGLISLPMLWWLWRHGRLNLLSALLVGVTIGSGFSALETAGYAYHVEGTYLHIENIVRTNNTIVIRSVACPFAHAPLTAIFAYGLTLAWKSHDPLRKILWTIAAVIFPILLHAIWDWKTERLEIGLRAGVCISAILTMCILWKCLLKALHEAPEVAFSGQRQRPVWWIVAVAVFVYLGIVLHQKCMSATELRIDPPRQYRYWSSFDGGHVDSNDIFYLTFSRTGGTFRIPVKHSSQWWVRQKGDADWLDVEATGDSIILHIKANESDSMRSVPLTLRSGYFRQHAVAMQQGVPLLQLSSKKFIFPAEGGKQDVIVATNGWKWDWKRDGRGYYPHQHGDTLRLTCNPLKEDDESPRNGIVVVSTNFGLLRDTIQITQSRE